MLLNKERAVEIMRKYKLDAIIASTKENVQYLSDFDHNLPFIVSSAAYAIFPLSTDIPPTLVVSRTELFHLTERPSWMPGLRVWAAGVFTIPPNQTEAPLKRFLELDARTMDRRSSGPKEALAQALADLGLTKGRLGFDDYRVGLRYAKDVLAHADIVDAFEIFREIRTVKTPEEIERLRAGIQINEKAEEAAINAIRDGASYLELLKTHERTMLELGGLPFFWTGSAGVRSIGLFPPSDYKLKKGDIVRIDCGGTYRDYWTDTGRTAVVGEPTDKLRAYYGALCVGSEDAMARMRPGVKFSELVRVANEAIRKSGIPHYDRPQCGHTIGLEKYDFIWISPDEDRPLEENMVFNLETPYYEFGWGGIQLEDTYRVTANGVEKLSTLKRDLFIC